MLALVTGADQLLLMSKHYDVVAERTLHTSEFGDEAQQSLGWGDKSTQFQGSVGKEVARATAVEVAASADATVRISWRGDGAHFAVTALDGDKRVLRFFAREEARLLSTGEPVAQLESALAWLPSGSIIAATQSQGRDVIFFERNGLRRYDFALRTSGPAVVHELVWSPDSTVLAVWIDETVQLWTRVNYHWCVGGQWM